MNNLQDEYELSLKKLRQFHQSGQTKSLEFRLDALEKLNKMIRENTEQISDALFADLRKPLQESLVSEVAISLEEIKLAQKNLKKWMQAKVKKGPLSTMPSKNRVFYESLGTVLIIGPWNYPFQLIISPLVGAIAAGNCAVLKPSEMTTHTAMLLESLFAKYFSPDFIKVVTGGVSETTALLNIKFDHIFFTGSTAVGKVVMKAAAQFLTPVTLELGGKSPVIVCEDADLELAARRIVWGKFYNAGQTCVAPDYIYVHEKVAKEFSAELKKCIRMQFGDDPVKSPDFARIVNTKNTERIISLIDPSKVTLGGKTDIQAKFIEPTILENVSWEDKVMGEEVFGPVMPILIYNDLNSVFSIIRSKPKPLAAYLFSKNTFTQNSFISDLSFGGGCINDVFMHISNPFLPFGGVGDSGFGSYHGYESFKTFSHRKSIMIRYNFLDLSARYAPYTKNKLKLLKRLFGL